MNRNVFCAFAALLAVGGAVGCGGRVDPIGSTQGEGRPLTELTAGATVQRAYVGADNLVTVGATPVVATFDLLGGARVALEVAAKDEQPLRYEVWRVRNDGTATLEAPVDSRSGFALEEIDADQDGVWALRFPPAQDGRVLVHTDCVGGLNGCTPLRQPGQTCPPGWQCDDGLKCAGGVCQTISEE
jgi:hypothetical protein